MANHLTQKPSKWFVLNEIEALVRHRPDAVILELGCGEARNFLPLLARYPTLHYVGLDPKASEVRVAAELLRPYASARVVNMLAYDGLRDLDETCDLVVSLSVLEHVKDLRRFLRFATEKTKVGGWVVHLYDLGHALYPTSLSERLRVVASMSHLTRRFVPETRFASYVDRQAVETLLRATGVEVERVTHHNMPNHVRLVKRLPASVDGEQLLGDIATLEVRAAGRLDTLAERRVEAMFPSVCVWGRRVR